MNYSLNFDFGTCTVGPLGRGKKKQTKLQMMLGDDPFENSMMEQLSLINKAIFQAPAPSYSKRYARPFFFRRPRRNRGAFFFPSPLGVVSSSGFASARPSDPPLGLLFRSSPRSTADPSLNPPSRFSQRPPLVPRGLRVLGQHGGVPLPRGDGAV